MLIKNTMLYRRLRYIKKRYKGRTPINNGLIIFMLIVFYVFVKYIGNRFIPYMDEFIENSVKSQLNLITYDVIGEAFKGEIYYDDFICIDKDKDGQIAAITTNTGKINAISSKLTQEIQNRVISANTTKMGIPFGVLFGDTILYNMGPKIHIKIGQYGNLKTEFKSEFISEGINQTKHRIFLLVKMDIGISGAFIKKKYNVETPVLFAETVIVGKVPELYCKTN